MSTAQLRVATWNLEHASPRRRKHGEAVRAVICKAAADLWVLTESDPGFVPHADYRLLAHSTEPRDARTGRAWVAIWAREDVAASPVAPLTADPSRTAAACVHLSSHARVLVYGTVLPWRSDGLWAGSLGERFGKALTAQADEWKTLRDRHSAELCLAGDFNQELTGPIRVGSRMGRAALRGLLKQYDLSCPTSEPADPIGKILGRGSIDHIVISAGLQAATANGQPRVTVIPSVEPLPRHLSDHYGVSVELTPTDIAMNHQS